MKNITTFQFDNPIKGVLLPMLLAAMGLFWIVLLIVAWKGVNVSFASKYWVFFGFLLLNSTNSFLYQNIYKGADVLSKLRTPFHLWSAFLKGAVRSAVSVWALVIAAMVLLVTVAIPSWQVLTVAAIVSLAMCASTLAALSSQGRLPRFFLWAAWTCGLAFAVLIMNKADFDSHLSDADKIPAFMRWLLVMAWPALAFNMWRTWQATPPIHYDSAKTSPLLIKEKISAYWQRFSTIGTTILTRRYHYGKSKTELISIMLFNQMVLSNFLITTGATSWNDNVGLGRLFVILCLSMISFNCLVFKDLHWRHVLAPNHLRRRALGWHIFKYSAGIQLIMLATVACIAIFFTKGIFNFNWAQIGSIAWQQRLAPFELIAAVACAVVLSASAIKSAWQIASVATIFALASIFMFVTYGDIPKWPAWPVSDWAYALGLLTFSALLIIFSNKLWTAKRLVNDLRPT